MRRPLYLLWIGLCSVALQTSFAQQGDPCPRCVTVLESRIACPTDSSGTLQWTLTLRNDSNFAITYAFFVQSPANIAVNPNPYIFSPPLQPGETRTINFTLNGNYLGQTRLCFDIVFYNASLNRCCRLQTCVDLPQCCFFIVRDSIVCEPHTGDFLYTFTLFNQFPAIVQYVVVVSQTPGVTVQPALTVLTPPIGYLGQATVTVRIRGATPGQTVRLAIGLLDFLGGLCCSIEHQIVMPPCCLQISEPVVECTERGNFYEFTLTNWFPAPICYIAVFPQTPGVSVAPNPIQLLPPLQYGESRRIRLLVTGLRCGGEVCLRLVLLDCMFRMCCSDTTCFEVGAPPVSRLWTTTADFEQGESDNIDTSNDELKLPREQTFEYPWVWVTNSANATVSKIDARTYKEVARYRMPGFVSRTTVDRFGNVWVECRGDNSVLQILDERNWSLAYDFNNNDDLDTSRDLNNSGCIGDAPNEILPFGEDELVVRYYKLTPYGTFPRALAIDLNGYLWVGLYSAVTNNNRLIQIDPNLSPAIFGPHVGGGTPPVLENIFSGISAQQFVRPYGMAAAASGFIYVADTPERFPGAIAEFCPGDPAVPGDAQVTQVVTIPATSEGYRAQTYGIVVDRDCVVWSADWNTQGRLIRWEPWLGAAGVAVSSQGLGGRTRGVNVDLNGYVWTSLSDLSGMARWNRNTLTIDAAYNDTCSPNHSGIGIAFGGQVVNPARPGGNSPTVTFINPQALVQTGCVNCPGINPYNYNDFTGAVLRFATNEGIWRAVYDGGCEDRIWGRLNWNAFIPQGTSVVVRVRAGNSQPILTEWQTVGNGQEFCIRGRYLEVEVRLSRTPRITRDCNYQRCAQNGEFITPIVYDIRATSLCACPPQSLRDVYGKVVCDSDGDGVASPADRPLQGWAVTIEDQQGNRLTRFTNEQGEYRFTDIPSGEYRLVQLTRPGWLPINPVNGEAEIEVNDSPVQLDFVNRLLGDVNGDGCVDDADLLAVLFAFGATGENMPEDITMDGVVDDADLLIVLFNFGADC